MKKKWLQTGIILLFILAPILLFKAIRHEKSEVFQENPAQATFMGKETVKDVNITPLPDSVLYYGEIREIILDAQGKISRLHMESQRDGAYVMKLGDNTRYIDSGERKSFDPSILTAGDRVYVFCSPITARTLPPQTVALAIVRNIPMDASCPMYHQVEKLSQEGESLRITTDNGEKTLEIDDTSTVLSYEGAVIGKDQILEENHIMAWYWDRGEEILHASHVMVLPPIENGR